MKIVQVLFNQPGQSFIDTSGQNLSITKTGTFKPAPPLTSRTQNSILIEPSNSLSLNSVPIGIRSHEQESFSISFYIKLGSSFADQCELLFDSTNSLGFRIAQSNISFTVSSSGASYILSHKLSSISKKIFVQATYSKGVITLFIDGLPKSQIELPEDFEFKATSAPSLLTSCASSFLMLDKIEVFNEPLSQSQIVLEKDLDSLYQNPGQIMSLDGASYFSFSRDLKPVATGFSYGKNKFISTAQMVNLEESSRDKLTLINGLSSGYFTDSVFIPTVEDTSHNQIDWYGDSGGIIVSYNTDGSDTYTEIANHSSIPGFTGGMIYYKVQLLRYGALLKSPEFSNLSFVVYDSKLFSSDNTLYSMSTGFNYTSGEDTSFLIDQSSSSGIQTSSGGFSIDVDEARSVEFMFMPYDLAQTCLIDCGDSRYSWSAAGNITKSNISSIYVNGVDVYSQTSVSNVFIPGLLHHVVVTFSSDEPNNVFINQSKTGTLIGPDNRYSHLGIYDYDMSAKAISHYKHFSSRVSEPTVAETFFIGEDSYSGFNVDRVVLSTQ